MKDLILISAYCPDQKREKLLNNLVDSIPKDDFDILITSHTTISQDIQDKVNYIFYDQENPLYHDMESAPFYWERLKNNSGKVFHTKLHKPLHILAILRLKRFGYQIGKMLGYKKLHCLEYDSLVIDPQIFVTNNHLLNSYSSVIYKNEELGNSSMHGSFKSINLNELSNELLEYDELKIKNYFKFQKKSFLPEQYSLSLFSKLNITINPSKDFLPFIQTGLYSSNDSKFEFIPYIKDDILFLYGYNNSFDNSVSLELQLDDNISNINLNPLVWSVINLGPYNSISYIKTSIQNKLYFELDFNENNNREVFKSRHFYE
jgi:hypothetical protein